MPIDLDAIKERLKELNGDRPRRPATPEPYWRSGRSRELPFERRTDYRTGSLLAEYGEQKFDKNGKLLRRAINGWIIIGKTFSAPADSGDGDIEYVLAFHSLHGKQRVTVGWLRNNLERGLVRVEVY